MKLNNLADIQSGYQFRGRVEPHPQGDIAVIQVKDLRDNAGLRPDTLTKVKLDKAAEPYLIHDGDVLFLSRGHRLFAAAITSPLHRTIAPGYFFVIRLHDPRALPEYLAWYINQPPAQNRLKPSHAGTHMPIIPKWAFEELEIELPPIQIQQAIVALSRLSDRERQLSAELEATRRQLIDTACLRAISANSKGSQP